ncbi:uncharacterized protein LOC120697968 isoform X2 [Panicum virgatum]|uniref:uncharacterized protein LOC120697968 isoform X2 n=1 Tax=Panicum virgatum TaxID=38727 RepID=UPI0019D6740F|nr:uncharacterized protein LOC120697968 isoform X2 [Panicum virgatum]
MPSLVNAFVGITCNCDDICNKLVDPTSFHCGCEFCVTSGNIGHDYRHSVLLKGLSEARNLDLISAPEMFIFKWDLRWLPIFSNLETLLLNEYFCMSDDLSALTCILEHSPLLKKLTLELFSQSYKYKVEMKGSFSLMERPATISEHLKIVEVKCQAVDDRVLKVLKFLCTFNILARPRTVREAYGTGYVLFFSCHIIHMCVLQTLAWD